MQVRYFASVLLLGALIGTAQAQQPAPPDRNIDAATRAAVVAELAKEIEVRYVFEDKGRAVAAQLRASQKQGAFESHTSARAFAAALTKAVQEPTKDAHLRVSYSDFVLPPRVEAAKPSQEELDRNLAQIRNENFGVQRVERLPGNIGYIDLRNFHEFGLAGEAIASAMTLIAHTDALIVDLRKNGGGDPNTVAFMTSYLFDERTHLNDLVWREGNRVEQFSTAEWVPGKRFGQKKDVYVLTSKDTFSGAEEFSYNLKNLKRATLIGETTGGGAHPGDLFRLHDHFGAFIATGRARSPITGTNWEGTGVKPDIDVPADKALNVAQAMALKKMVAAEKSERRRAALASRLKEVEQ